MAVRESWAEFLNDALRGEESDRVSLREFIAEVAPQYPLHYRHCGELVEHVQAVCDGQIKRLLIEMPPGHYKSFTASQLCPAYFMYREPWRKIGIGSFGQRPASRFNLNALNFYRMAGGDLRKEQQSRELWGTPQGGECWAAGIGGPVTSFRAHLLIMDDPVKDQEAAKSEHQLEEAREWYSGVWRSRRTPWSETDLDASEIMILTRWSEEDLAGFALQRSEWTGEEWTVLAMPALAWGEDRPEFPKTVHFVPDWRKEGEALCDGIMDREFLLAEKGGLTNTGQTWLWNAQYQQHPQAEEGRLIDPDWFSLEFEEDAPDFLQNFRCWDPAFTEAGGDWTAGGLAGIHPDKSMWLLDMKRAQIEAPDVREWVLQTQKEDPRNTLIGIEKAHSGLGIFQDLVRNEDTHPFIHGIPPTGGDLLARGAGWLAWAKAGRIKIACKYRDPDTGEVKVREWAQAFIKECRKWRALPTDTDDQIAVMWLLFELVMRTRGALMEQKKPPKRGTPEYYEDLRRINSRGSGQAKKGRSRRSVR